jgi:Domain of unknown function (DUF3786)
VEGALGQDWILKDIPVFDGYKKIYEDLIDELRSADIAASAERLGLPMNEAGEAEIPFIGAAYLISNSGVRRFDGERVPETTASALIHYILLGSSSRPAGRFVTFSELAGPLFKEGSYSASALEQPIIKRFQGRVTELIAIAESVGGRLGGEGGVGSISLILDLLPHILLQLVFYDSDDEFPARATLLFDRNATQLIDFEALAFLVTIFIQFLTKR